MSKRHQRSFLNNREFQDVILFHPPSGQWNITPPSSTATENEWGVRRSSWGNLWQHKSAATWKRRVESRTSVGRFQEPMREPSSRTLPTLSLKTKRVFCGRGFPMKDDKMNRKSFLFLVGFLYLVINHVAIYRSHPHKGADPIPMVTFVNFCPNVFQDASESLSVLNIHIGCTLADGNVDTPETHSSLDKHGQERSCTDIYTWPCTLIDSLVHHRSKYPECLQVFNNWYGTRWPFPTCQFEKDWLLSCSKCLVLLRTSASFALRLPPCLSGEGCVYSTPLSLQRVKSKGAFKGQWCTKHF